MKQKLLVLLLLLSLLLSSCQLPSDFTLPEDWLAFEEASAAYEGDSLWVHFIDVGQADCALLEYGGQFILIDGGNRDDTSLVVSYLAEQGVQELEAIVCTHIHEDHVGGIPGVLDAYPAKALYAPTDSYSSGLFRDIDRRAQTQKLAFTVPAPGDTLTLGALTLTFVGPVTAYEKTNNTSLVLRADFGDSSFLFTGDMETLAEHDLMNYWDDFSPEILDVDVLKVGHHGSYSSSGYRFLYETTPDYGILSLGADNDYGYPHKEPMERFDQAGVTTLRTDLLGSIVAFTDGDIITFTWDNTSADPHYVGDAQPEYYIGNRNSRNFHSPLCDGLPSQRNQVLFSGYQEAMDAGFIPCYGCLGGGTEQPS